MPTPVERRRTHRLPCSQAPHDTFERLGDDLWYHHKEPICAEQVFWVGSVPTLARAAGQARAVTAVASTLAALLGYDRSGLGEAIVVGHGMPLRVTDPSASLLKSRGDIIVKFPIQARTTTTM